MKKLASILALLLFPSFALGQTGAYSGHSFVGGTPATTSGMNSSNYMDGIIPGASITVYLTGTSTKATIYADGSNTRLSNPFFSNLAPGTNPGGFIFWAAQNQGLDIQAQGGMGNASCTTSPLCYSTATTLQVDVYPNNSFSPLPSLNCTGTGSSQVCTFSGTVTAGTVSAKNSASIGPRYDVTQFGAVGNGVAYDTAAIQAAFDACWNNRTLPNGGIVEFPGAKTYLISSTINAYDGCKIEGINQAAAGSAGPVEILFQSPTAQGTVYSVTGFTTANNTSPYLYASSSPAPFPHPSKITLAASNSLSVNQWVLLQGCTSYVGLSLNNIVAQVAVASSTSFTVVTSSHPNTLGTFTDSCTATVTNVGVAFDANARYGQEVKSIELTSVPHGDAAYGLGVGLLFGSRVDTGTQMLGTYIDGAKYFNYYFAAGGINIKFDDSWRSDAVGMAAIYWRIEGSTNLKLNTGEFNNAVVGGTEGGAILLDNQGCSGASVQLTIDNVIFEADSSDDSGRGTIMMNGCSVPSNYIPQFRISTNNVIFGVGTSFYSPAFVMSPPNDAALSLSMVNTISGTTTGTPMRFIGLPSLARYDLTGANGIVPFFGYNSSFISDGFTGNIGINAAVHQFIGDSNFGQMFQYGKPASMLLYSDTAFAALPNATTLYPGQILAPPAYWYKANGKRYALDVVYQAGTTGSPNGGSTTCVTQWPISAYSITSNVLTLSVSGSVVHGATVKLTDFPTSTFLNNQTLSLTLNNVTSTQISAPFTHADVSLTTESGSLNAVSAYACSSATDLNVGQYVKLGSDATKQISSLSSAVDGGTYVGLGGGVGVYTSPTTLQYVAPTFGLEMQIPTKSSAVPTTLAWSQGDWEQNSGAVANGIAGWVNVAGGTPGTWAGIPLGDANGKLAPSQVVNGTTSTTPICFNGTGGALTNVGCSGGAASPTNTPAWLQYLGDGSDGAFTLTSGSGNLTQDKYYTTFNVSSGATLSVNSFQGLTIHATGACTINGTITTTSGATAGNASVGGAGGGGGGGTAAGTAGGNTLGSTFGGQAELVGGTLGSAGGGAGGNGPSTTNQLVRHAIIGGANDGQYWFGSTGGNGGSSGGAGGKPGYAVVLICASITGTGTINAAGFNGGDSTGNNVGAGGGGGGGIIILSSQAAETYGLTLNVAGGVSGSCVAFTGCGVGGSGGTGTTATFSGW